MHFSLAVFTTTDVMGSYEEISHLLNPYYIDRDSTLPNPNQPKFDFCEVGGRYDFPFPAKDGTIIYGTMKVRDIDFNKLRCILNMDGRFATSAAITPDGRWHEPDYPHIVFVPPTKSESEEFYKNTNIAKEVFYANFYKNFIQPAIINDWYMTIVDCHN